MKHIKSRADAFKYYGYNIDIIYKQKILIHMNKWNINFTSPQDRIAS